MKKTILVKAFLGLFIYLSPLQSEVCCENCNSNEMFASLYSTKKQSLSSEGVVLFEQANAVTVGIDVEAAQDEGRIVFDSEGWYQIYYSSNAMMEEHPPFPILSWSSATFF